LQLKGRKEGVKLRLGYIVSDQPYLSMIDDNVSSTVLWVHLDTWGDGGHYSDVKAKPRPQAPGPFDVGDCGNDSEAGFDKDPEAGLDNASEAGGVDYVEEDTAFDNNQGDW
jgi:hypothetical protein